VRHEEAYERLPSLVGLRAADVDDRELRAHVDGCETCQRRLRTLREVDGALRSGPSRSEPSERLEERVLAVPRVHPQEDRGRQRRWLVGGLGAAAAVIAALALVATSPWSGSSNDGPGAFDSVQTAAIAEPRRGVEAMVEFGEAMGPVQPVRLTVSGLGGDGRYELWLAGGGGEVAVGTFKPGKDGACTVMMDAPAGEWSAVRIRHAGANDPGADVASGPV
jgi:hypothetical protein